METIRVTLSNRLATFDCDQEQLEALKEFWSFYPPGYRYARSFKLWLVERHKSIQRGEPDASIAGWDGKIRLLHGKALPAGLFRATREEAESELDVRFLVTHTIPKRTANLKILPCAAEEDDRYSYQPQCITAMQKAIRRGGGIVLAGTGVGKTRIAGGFFQTIPGISCLFVVDTLDLLDQAQKELSQWTGETVGKIGESVFDPQRLTVATIQTMDRHRGKVRFKRWFTQLGIVVVDELHDQMGRRNFKLLSAIKPMAIYGLTATLQLSKKEVRFKAHSFAGPVIFEFSLQQGVDKKVLKAGKVVQLLFPPLKLVPATVYDSYRQQVVENTIKHDACFDIVTELIAQGRVVIVLVERIAHLKTLDQLFSSIPHEIAYGPVSKTDRQKAIYKIENNEVSLILANKVFRKGINLKRADAAVDMAEQLSMNDAKQKYGRLVRLHPDKQDLLYVDIGTQKGKLDYGRNAAKAAVRRRKAYRELELPFKKFDVEDGDDAVKILEQCDDRRRAKKSRVG